MGLERHVLELGVDEVLSHAIEARLAIARLYHRFHNYRVVFAS